MKTAILTSHSTQKVPPLSALLLVLAALLALAAWRVLEINQNQIPHEPATHALPQEMSASAPTRVRSAYQARRHQAVSLGEGPVAARVTQSSSGGTNAKKAVL